MPRADYRRCRSCGRPSVECGPLSHTRLCGECWPQILQDAAAQIRLGVGEYSEKRRYGIARAEFGPRVALALKQAGLLGPENDENLRQAV